MIGTFLFLVGYTVAVIGGTVFGYSQRTRIAALEADVAALKAKAKADLAAAKADVAAVEKKL